MFGWHRWVFSAVGRDVGRSISSPMSGASLVGDLMHSGQDFGCRTTRVSWANLPASFAKFSGFGLDV
jgi:hypothetical protein